VNEKQLAALIKKNQAKAVAKAAKARPQRGFDPTLAATQPPDEDDDRERKEIFREMKRRDF
jgi:hypothetical protein